MLSLHGINEVPNPTAKYHLFLDDGRQPKDVVWIELPPLHWVVVKSFKEFVDCIQTNGVPATVSFDHDLCDEHYKEYTVAHDERSLSYGKIRYEVFKEKTGLQCAEFLVNYCIDNNIQLPLYYIHTLNGIGRMNIFKCMEGGRPYLQTFTITK